MPPKKKPSLTVERLPPWSFADLQRDAVAQRPQSAAPPAPTVDVTAGFKCVKAGCKRELEGFESEAQRNSHMKQSHRQEYDDLFRQTQPQHEDFQDKGGDEQHAAAMDVVGANADDTHTSSDTQHFELENDGDQPHLPASAPTSPTSPVWHQLAAVTLDDALENNNDDLAVFFNALEKNAVIEHNLSKANPIALRAAELQTQARFTNAQLEHVMHFVEDITPLLGHHELPMTARTIQRQVQSAVTDAVPDMVTVALQTKLNNVELQFHYADLLDCAMSILLDRDLALQMVYRQDPECPSINEAWTAGWWREAEAALPAGCSLLAFILYADATRVVERSQLSFHPIYMSLANLPIAVRHSDAAKRLVGFLPKIPAAAGIRSVRAKPIWRHAYYTMVHECFAILLQPLRSSAEWPLHVIDSVGRQLHLVPRVAFAIADYVEQVLWMHLYGPNGECACGHCLCEKDQLHSSTHIAPERTEASSRATIEEARALGIDEKGKGPGEHVLRASSLRPLHNAFWDLPDCLPYQLCAADLMHLLDEGIFRHLCELIIESISNKQTALLDQRMMDMTDKKHPGLNELPNHFSTLTGMEARHMVTAMQVLPLAILDCGDEQIVQLVVQWAWLYEKTVQFSFTNDELAQLQLDMDSWAFRFVARFGADNANFPKFHVWLRHLVYQILRFGSALGFHSGRWEYYHAIATKQAYRASNRKDVIPQMMTKSSQRNAAALLKAAKSRTQQQVQHDLSTEVVQPALVGVGELLDVQDLPPKYQAALASFAQQLQLEMPREIQLAGGVKNLPLSEHMVRASPSFQGRERNDNIVVDGGVSDVGSQVIWYASVVLFARFGMHSVAFVQWFDAYPVQKAPWQGYERLLSVAAVDVIPIESILRPAHIVLNPERTQPQHQQYLVNHFVFQKYY